MSRHGEDTGRQPQFTNTQYEIPSWQTPWNKPWYQRTDGNNEKSPNRFKHNARGHLIDCTCVNCEDDLEKAFTPGENTTRQSVSDIPKDRHEEVKIQVHLENLNIKNGEDANTSSASASSTSSAPKKVYLFSDLAEVTTSANSNNSLVTTRSTFASSLNQTPSPSTVTTGMTHDSFMDVFDSLTAIQAISKETKDIQTRVYNYRGKSDTQEYKVMKDLLLSLRRELNRVNSNVEWFAVSKKMALEAISKTLQMLEQRAKEAEAKTA